MGKWTLKFSRSFPAPVWNLYPVSDGGVIIETRNNEDEELRFYQLDNELAAAKEIIPDDCPWFCQIVYADKNSILIREFDPENNPDYRKLHCYDRSGSKVWSREGIEFLRIDADSIICQDIEGNEVIFRREIDSASDSDMMQLPAHYLAGSEFFQQVSSYIENNFGLNPVRCIDYFETGQAIIFSYYTENGLKLRLDLVVLDAHNGETMLAENLGKDFEGIADPPFLFYQRNLIFVKERRHFFVYALPTE